MLKLQIKITDLHERQNVSHFERTKNQLKFPTQVFDIGKGQHSPITGLEFHLVPHTRGKYIIIATTQTRMYQFQACRAEVRISLSVLF